MCNVTDPHISSAEAKAIMDQQRPTTDLASDLSAAIRAKVAETRTLPVYRLHGLVRRQCDLADAILAEIEHLRSAGIKGVAARLERPLATAWGVEP